MGTRSGYLSSLAQCSCLLLLLLLLLSGQALNARTLTMHPLPTLLTTASFCDSRGPFRPWLHTPCRPPLAMPRFCGTLNAGNLEATTEVTGTIPLHQKGGRENKRSEPDPCRVFLLHAPAGAERTGPSTFKHHHPEVAPTFDPMRHTQVCR